MSSTLDRIRQLRQDALDAKAGIEQRITQTRNRINEVCRSGILPFDEAWSAYEEAFDSYAEQGRRQLEQSMDQFTRPRHENPTVLASFRGPPNVAEPFRVYQHPSGKIDDPGPLVAWLNRDAILKAAKAHIKVICAESNIPPAEEREAEIERLVSEFRALEEERDDIEDELSELFANEQPSQRTQEQERKAEAQRGLDILNEPIDERNRRNTPPEPSPSPVTIQDGEGRDVDDPGHGPSVRRSA